MSSDELIWHNSQLSDFHKGSSFRKLRTPLPLDQILNTTTRPEPTRLLWYTDTLQWAEVKGNLFFKDFLILTFSEIDS